MIAHCSYLFYFVCTENNYVVANLLTSLERLLRVRRATVIANLQRCYIGWFTAVLISVPKAT